MTSHSHRPRTQGAGAAPLWGPPKNQAHPVGDWEPLSVFKQENNTVKPELETITLMTRQKEQEQKRKRLVSRGADYKTCAKYHGQDM